MSLIAGLWPALPAGSLTVSCLRWVVAWSTWRNNAAVCIVSDDPNLPGMPHMTQNGPILCEVVWIEIRATLIVFGYSLSSAFSADKGYLLAIATVERT